MPEEALVLFWSNPAIEITPSRNNDKYEIVVSYPERDIMQSGWVIGEKHLSKHAAMISAGYGQGRVVLIGFRSQHRALTNDFLVSPLDMSTEWKPSGDGVFEVRDRAKGKVKWTEHPRRSRVRIELATPGDRGSLRVWRLAAEARARLRGCVEQGDEPRPVRPRVM
jgi:hypothetical protein